MESFAVPLRALANRAGRFMRRPGARVLNVVTDSNLRQGTLEIVLALEYFAYNRSPFVRLDERFLRAETGWLQRIETMRATHEKRRAGMLKNGHDLGELPPLPEQAEPYVQFGLQVQQLLEANRAPLEGLVVVFAPTEIEDVACWARELGGLVATPTLASVRWVIVDHEVSSVPELFTRLGDQATRLECFLDEDAVRRDLGQRLDAAADASPSAPGPAQVGSAWPRGATPPSRGGKENQEPLTPEQQETLSKQLDVPVGLLGDPIKNVRKQTLRAAQSLRAGKVIAAIGFQREAVESCRAAGLTREGLVMEMALATFVVQAGQPERAEVIYQELASRAEEEDFFDLSAQAWMAGGALRLVARDPDNAAVMYTRAGVVARDGGEETQAIEGFRMAGQLRAEAGDRDQATRLWTEAIAVAKSMPSDAAAQTSAPMAGRQLAELLRKMKLHEQAASVEALVLRLEASQ